MYRVLVVLAVGCGRIGFETTHEDAVSGDGGETDVSADTAVTLCSQLVAYRIFITVNKYQPNFGGLAGGDAICLTEANANALGGRWQAWLADDLGSPATRACQGTAPYRRLDGQLVASDWTSLAAGNVVTAVNWAANGTTVPLGSVWTDVDTPGVAARTGRRSRATTPERSARTT